MMTFVFGGSGSGKSEFAEQLLVSRCLGQKRYYVATMEVFGEEGRKKVERHRKMRAGKGFETIEKARNLGDMVAQIEENSSVLLECLSNLVANELFLEEGMRTADAVVEQVMQELRCIQKHAAEVVIVSSNVFEDGNVYEEGTMTYLEVLSRIHRLLAQEAEEVIEVVVGIPIWKKGKE